GHQFKIELGGGLSHTVQLFNPGFAFITTCVVLLAVGRLRLKNIVPLLKEPLRPLVKTFISIFFVGSLTYLMVMTEGHGDTGKGMLATISQSLMSQYLPCYSAFLGAFGAFLAGSATVSNLLFTDLQVQGALS